MQRIAIIGSGIAGLGAAWLLQRHYDITLLEAENRLGGHAHTVMVGDQPVDTGFIVFNDQNYPRLQTLLAQLGVATQPSDMSFAVSIDGGVLEWAGDNWRSLFAQKRLLASLPHWQMIANILRFNRQGKRLLASGVLPQMTLGDFLDRNAYGEAFRSRYLLPMGAAIWSAPTRYILDFPLTSFLRFFNNHGLLDLANRPQWRTVTGGSQKYVQALANRLKGRICMGRRVIGVERGAQAVRVYSADSPPETFDQVIFACHADTARHLLGDAESRERHVLEAFRFQSNRAVLHSDPALMPCRQAVWSSWNYLTAGDGPAAQHVAVTYWLNRLQHISGPHDYFVSLNPLTEPAPEYKIDEFMYDHPTFDTATHQAQRSLNSIQGINRSWYCGAWCGYGFHEDGLAAAENVARSLGVPEPWKESA